MQRQSEMFSQIVEDTSSIMQEAAKEGTAAEKAARHADLVKKTYEKSVAHWHDLADIIGKSGKEATDVIHGRVRSSLTEMKSGHHKNNGKDGNLKKAA
jgi:phasin family protein